MGRFFRYTLVLTAVALLGGCSVTRRVPEGERLLTKNRIEEDRDTPKKQRIKSEEVERYVQPRTNRKFLGTNLYLQLYNMASPDSTRTNWINRRLRGWGEAPVLLDTTLVERSAGLINSYVQYAGFRESEVTYRIDTSRRKRARVTYFIDQGEPYRIGNIAFEFKDDLLRQIVMQDSASTLLRPGDILDGNVLGAEKERLTRYLKNNGYYDFKQTNIEFFGDETDDPLVKDLVVEFKPRVADYTSQGEAVYENSSIYRISRIVINPDYDPMLAATDPDYLRNMDTTEYRGLFIVHPRGRQPKVRPAILRQAVNLYPNYIYNEDEVRQAHSNIMRLGFYRNSDIIFSAADSERDNIVTFIGGDDDQGDIETTTEKYLVCHINCIPALRQSYKIEFEGTTSSSFSAISATVGYQNRNLFRGAEILDATVTGGYEFMRERGAKGAFEIGGALGLSFPRFITPFKVDRYNRTVNPRTRVELSVNSQNRRFYERTLSGASWGYSWSNRKKSSFTLRPIDLNLVKMGYLDQAYLELLENPYLENSYRDQLIAGISGSYVYNSQLGAGIGRKAFVLRFNWETAGNLLSGLSHAFDNKVTREGERYYRLFGIRYAQYFRLDGSISDKIIFGPKTNIAFRLYGGVAKAYGNTSSVPFDRLFYAGGSNSMRGWLPRRLGAGNEKIKDGKYANQLGDMKLEANMEFRFPVWSFLQGAVFFDLGNVWYMAKKSGVEDEAVFRFDRFYRQLGFNTGLGARFDINVAVIRFDFGYKLHNPNNPVGERWVNRFKIGDSVINFGVGYPF